MCVGKVKQPSVYFTRDREKICDGEHVPGTKLQERGLGTLFVSMNAVLVIGGGSGRVSFLKTGNLGQACGKKWESRALGI